MSRRTNLIKARKENSLTQSSIARSVGITKQQYQRLEAGTSRGSVKVWQRLSELLKQPADFLWQQEDTLQGEEI